MATVADLKTRYPELATVPDVRIVAILADCEIEMRGNWLAADRSIALLALAAHMISVEGASGAMSPTQAGPVKSEKVGDVQVQFDTVPAVQSGTSEDYGSTAYGRAYLRLLRRSFPSIVTA